MGPDLTIDLNLVRGDQPQVLNMLAIKAIQAHVEVFILRRGTVDFPDLSRYKYKKDFFPYLIQRIPKTTYFNQHHNCITVTNSYSFERHA